MKYMKKLMTLLAVLTLALAMAVPAFAASNTGTITIDNAVTGTTYKAYRIFDLEKYSLQGTTQGNGLTGGVPPVRFSM